MTPGFLVRIGGPPLTARLAPPAGEPGAVQVALADPHGRVRQRQRGSVLAVADLRLDNRDALRARLALPEGDDLDVLIAGYRRWGRDLATHLEGPFAYVIWDADRSRASFARDPLGLRPLYRADREGGVLIGSSLPLIRQAVPRALSPEAVVDHLAGTLFHPTQTITAGVERVSPATLGSVRAERGRAVVSTRPYWALGQAGTLAGISDADAEVTFRDAFDRSVLTCLGDAPGALLSGGLDSSSIVATARALRPEAALPTFSLVYDHRQADERRYLDAVARHSDVDPVRIDGEALSMLTGLDDDLRAVGEPFLTPNLFMARVLYAQAADRGLGAVLDGFAGDNVVGHGDVWLTELALGLRWPSFARELQGAARRATRPRRAAWTLLRHYALAPLVRPFRSPAPEVHFLHPDLAPTAPARDPQYRRDGDLHRADLAGAALPRAFETAYARASALGVEPRFPFADRALVELCLALPPRQRVRDGLTRSILRRAMGDRLPPELRSRDGKARLGLNFERALFERDPEGLRRLVFEDVPGASEWLDVGAVQAAYHRATAHEGERGRLALPLWRAVSFARWRSLPTTALAAVASPPTLA